MDLCEEIMEDFKFRILQGKILLLVLLCTHARGASDLLFK